MALKYQKKLKDNQFYTKYLNVKFIISVPNKGAKRVMEYKGIKEEVWNEREQEMKKLGYSIETIEKKGLNLEIE